jgi:4,5-DOPA dioxygenase extradiol
MDRKQFIKSLGILSLGGAAMKLNALNPLLNEGTNSETMPVLFVGHGSPMNAIEDNLFSREIKAVGKNLQKPKAILMISAHWETKGTFVTAQDFPPTIHDFGGFPKELFDARYPAPGSKWLREETKQAVDHTPIGLDENWGFDHGCWSVTKNMFPNADIPLIQLSLDYTKDAQYHYDLAKQLSALRHKGVLIIGSGNMVHNFGYAQLKGNDFNSPFGHDWALAANEKFKKLISNDDHKSLINYKSLGKEINLSVPTPEHYLPLLYVLALKNKTEKVTFFNDVALAGSFTMTSVIIK